MTYPPGPPGPAPGFGGGPPTGPGPSYAGPPPVAPPLAGPPPATAPIPPAPAGAPTPSGARPPRRRLRILGRAVLVLVVVGALAGTTAWGVTNRSSAEEWRDRSRASDAKLTESLEQLTETRAALEDARTRLRNLAATNADETDRNRILSEIVRQAPEVTSAMSDCLGQVTDLANDLIDALATPDAPVASLEARIDDVNGSCADALDAATALEESIDELGL